MIISHKYKFIFIKTTKTAGTSIELFLSQCCGSEDVVTPIYPHVEPHRARNYKGIWNPFPELIENKGHRIRSTISDLLVQRKFYNHIRSLAVKSRISNEIWDNYYKFCVERNPWDKTLSHYHMINDRSGGNMSLDEYLEKKQYCYNYPKYTDLDGNISVDHVIKYESLINELAIVFEKLNVPFEGALSKRAKSEHRSDTRPYQDVLSNDQRKIIEKAFKKEIDYHGYSF